MRYDPLGEELLEENRFDLMLGSSRTRAVSYCCNKVSFAYARDQSIGLGGGACSHRVFPRFVKDTKVGRLLQKLFCIYITRRVLIDCSKRAAGRVWELKPR